MSEEDKTKNKALLIGLKDFREKWLAEFKKNDDIREKMNIEGKNKYLTHKTLKKNADLYRLKLRMIESQLPENQRQLIIDLYNYKKARVAIDKEYFTLWGIFGGISKTDKIRAVDKLTDILMNKGSFSELDARHIRALEDGRLGQLVYTALKKMYPDIKKFSDLVTRENEIKQEDTRPS